MRRASAFAREHWPVLSILALAGLVRLVVAIAYQPALFYSDSWVYAGLAYGPQHFAAERPSGYPALLWLIALPGRSLTVVTAIQHLAGLATGGLVYALLRRLGVARWVACVAVALVLLDSYAITLEQTILTEAFFTLTLVWSAFLVAGPGRGRGTIAASGLLLGAAATMRVAAVFAIPVWLAYVAWRHRGAGTVALAACAVAGPVLAYSAVYDAKFGRFGLAAADGWFLYGRVGAIADCTRFAPPAETRDLCESSAQRREHPPVYYLWSGRSPANRRFGSPGDPVSSAPLRRFAMAVIRQRPLAYAGLVARDSLRYFQPGIGSPTESDFAISLPERPRTGPPWVDERLRAAYFPGWSPPWRRRAWLPHAYGRVAHPPRPLLALLVLAGLASAVLGLLGRGRWRLPHAAEAFMLTGMGMAMLVGATATSAFVVRYLVPSVPLLVCGGTVAVVDLVAARRLRGLSQASG